MSTNESSKESSGARSDFQTRLLAASANADREIQRRRAAGLPSVEIEGLAAELGDYIAVDRAAEQRREEARR
jgi:hypothetical protein